MSVPPDDARVPAYTIAADHPAIRAAAAALAAVYPGQDVLLACIGGTLPATRLVRAGAGRQDAVLLVLDRRREAARARTSSCASAGCVRACGPGKCCGGCSPPARTSWHRIRRRPEGIAMTETPYTAYSYLPPGSFPGFELTPEFGRVPPYAGARLTPEQAARSRRAAARQPGDQPARSPGPVPAGHGGDAGVQPHRAAARRLRRHAGVRA